MKKVILSELPNAADLRDLHKDWLERKKAATGLYFINSARAAAIVLLQFTHGSANRAREVVAQIGEEKLSPHERREAEVTHLLLMAHSLRSHERSDTAAMKRVVALRQSADKEALDGIVRSLRHWLKGQTLAQFARNHSWITLPDGREQYCKYVFTPPNKFSFVVTKIRKKSRPDKHP